MKQKTKAEVIQCPHFSWTLFRRGGVYYADGRKHGKGKSSLGTRDRSKAIQAVFELDRYVAEREAQASEVHAQEGSATPEVVSHDSPPLTIASGWEQYIQHRDLPVHLGGLKPSSIQKYHGHKKRLSAFCVSHRNDDWRSVNKDLLTRYAKILEGKYAPMTIHDDLTMQISVSSWLIKEGHLPQSCKIHWKLKKPAGSERYCYEREEVARMLQLSKAFAKNRWLYGAILLLSHTGARIGEAQNLRWTDIDFRNEVIHIRDESAANIAPAKRRYVKDGESRMIPMAIDLLDYLQSVRQQRGYVLIGDRGRQLNYNHIREAFIEQVIKPLSSEFPSSEEELGFKNGRFHSFRHFFVSECFAAGVPESDIRLWVGHSDSKVVALYRHIRDEIAKANIRKVDFGAP